MIHKHVLLRELYDYSIWLNVTDITDILDEVAIDYRIKSFDSIELKYDRHDGNSQVRKVFNDILGFRALSDNYEEVLSLSSSNLRLVDMSKGKANDDGYRGVHVYFQLDNWHYPIEFQINTLYDRQLNNWLHTYVYKTDYDNLIGIYMRKKYEDGCIRNEIEFREVLNNAIFDNEKT